MSIFSEVITEIDDFGSGATAKSAMVEFAGQMRDAIIATDKPSSVITIVNGVEGANLSTVTLPDGSIVFEFGYLDSVVQSILDLLISLSPYAPKAPGADAPINYRDAHAVFVDGQRVSEAPSALQPDQIVQIVNLEPYAHKIEDGLSLQAPNGVYEVVSSMAADMWGDAIEVVYSLDAVPDGSTGKGLYPILTIKARS